MNPELQKEIFARLDAFAAKLNVGAAYLWGVLVKQAFVVGVTDVLLFVVSGLLLWAFFYFLKKAVDGSTKYGEDVLACIVACVTGATGTILFLYSLSNIEEIVTCFVNPGYKALELLKAAL